MQDDIIPLDVDKVDPGVGYVYRWVNLVNGKMYIGSHDGSNPKYLASGIAIRQAFKKHGTDSFRREYLYVGENYRVEEQNMLEIVDAASNELYYNLKNTATGFGSGTSNPMFGKSGEDHPKFGFKLSEEAKQKLSEERKGNPAFGRRGEDNHNFGKPMSEATKNKLRELNLGEKSPNYGKKLTDEAKSHLSSLNKGKVYPKRQCPHCPAVGGGGAMSKYHFDNCKLK